MTRSHDRLTLIGHVHYGPTLKHMEDGTAFCNLGLVPNESFADASGETGDQAGTRNVEVSGELAKRCRDSLSEGSLVYVEGRVRTREWTADDGSRQRVRYLKAEDVKRLGGAPPKDVGKEKKRSDGREEAPSEAHFEPAKPLPF